MGGHSLCPGGSARKQLSRQVRTQWHRSLRRQWSTHRSPSSASPWPWRRLLFCHHPAKRSCDIVEFAMTCFGLAPAHNGALSFTCLPKAHPCIVVPALANEGSVPCVLWRGTESSEQYWKVETIVSHCFHVGQLRSLSEVTYYILVELIWYAHHGSRSH